jgi:hypothetical protein
MLPNISPAETLKMLQDNKARLVDVREADELAALRVPGAEAAPLSVISWMDLRPPPLNSPSYLPAIPETAPPRTATCCKSLRQAPHGRWKAASAPGPNRGFRWKPPNRRCPFFARFRLALAAWCWLECSAPWRGPQCYGFRPLWARGLCLQA